MSSVQVEPRTINIQLILSRSAKLRNHSIMPRNGSLK